MRIFKEKAKKIIAEYMSNRRLTASILSHLEDNALANDSEQVRSGLFIVPCDPYTVVGSRGDEAMIKATVDSFRNVYPDEAVTIVVSEKQGADKIIKAGLTKSLVVVNSWEGPLWPEKILGSIIAANPRKVVILGADCMDGAWSANLSMGLAGIYALSVNVGYDTRLLGFSYNSNPKKQVNRMFRRLKQYQPFNLRDKYSLERFENFTHCKGRLIADAAFLLSPDSDVTIFSDIRNWIVQKKSEGIKHVIAFNVHPMLRSYTSENEVRDDAIIIATNLLTLLNNRTDFALLLLPHDDRHKITDNTMLKPVFEVLQSSSHRDRVFYDQKVYRAAQIKAITGLVDGTISSRMHLAIASLGMQKPIMAVSYQGKFKGLLAHFELPDWMLMEPAELVDPKVFIGRFNQFLDTLQDNTQRVVSRLPEVVKLAKMNFE